MTTNKDRGGHTPPIVERKGYIAGLMGLPSLPGTYHETARRTYERGYDAGRKARLDECARGQSPSSRSQP